MNKFFLRVVILIAGSHLLFSQEDEKKINVDFSGYLEAFYGYDFNKPETYNRLDWIYNHSRHNEFNINMGMLRSKISYDNMYANIAIQAGTYVDDNYTAESLKLFHEAFLGVYLDKEKKHNLEVGIMPSYIGFESSSTFSNLTLTRSIMAESSPFYFTGIKYNFSANDKWSFSFITTNGWQRIEKPNHKALPTFGSQIVYSPTENTTINWSTYIGDEPIATDVLRTRYFNNIYIDHSWSDKWKTLAGFDYGTQKSSIGNANEEWKTITIITQYSFSEKWDIAARVEYFDDPKNVIVNPGSPFEVFGASLNLDFIPNSKLKFRTEAKWFKADENIFLKGGKNINNNLFISSALAFEF